VTAGDGVAVGGRSPKTDRPTRLKRLGTWLTDRSDLLKRLGKLAIVVSVLCVLVVGLWSLRSTPPTAAFTRVGGQTTVETAVDASRFWLTPPQRVVTTWTYESQEIMLGAAQCAMDYDAPLLFMSPDPKQQRLVDATIGNWQKTATGEGSARIPVTEIQKPGNVTSCTAHRHPAYANRLSTLEVPNQPPQPSQLPPLPLVPSRTLASVVVFAAAIAPWDPPDVAVGLALAAHMATTGQKVSLVVVPRYLEADPGLVDQLSKQPVVVTGGVVLGQIPTIPEATRALLRQLLTSPDRLAQVQADLTSTGGLVVGLLALFGLLSVAAPEVGGLVVLVANHRDLVAERKEAARREAERTSGQEANNQEGRLETGMTEDRNKIRRDRKHKAGSPDRWRAALGDKREVTVWLRSGWKVAGKVTDNADRAGTIWRLEKATLTREGNQSETAELVLVAVEDIELITEPRPTPAPTPAPTQ
jgi:hypothetical protein